MQNIDFIFGLLLLIYIQKKSKKDKIFLFFLKKARMYEDKAKRIILLAKTEIKRSKKL